MRFDRLARLAMFLSLAWILPAPVRADDDDTRPVWEITVTASETTTVSGKKYQTFQGITSGNERYERHVASMFATQRWHNQGVSGNTELGGGNETCVYSSVSGEVSDSLYTRDQQGDSIATRQIKSSGAANNGAGPGGASFLWDAAQKMGQFECSITCTGTSTDHMQHQDRDPSLRFNHTDTRPCTAGGFFTQMEEKSHGHFSCTPAKFGFIVSWSYSYTWKDNANATPPCTHTFERHGSASIRKYVKHEPMELVITPAGYQTWVPQAGKDENTLGNTLGLHAELKTKNGKPIPDEQKANKIKFSLTWSSKLPGICMNFPTGSSVSDDPAYDLQFPASENSGMKVSPANQPQNAETPDGAGGLTSADATLGCYDWGAYGKVVVTATLDDGEMIQGHLEGHDDQTKILIPRRQNNSYIADAWKQQNGITGGNDDDDSDGSPDGDGTKGDGLTLFEEYRGFMENGSHIFGDPKKKDFFIRDKINTSRSRDGIALFRSLSGLAVHDKFTAEEWPANRVINDNAGPDCPHKVDQHGIILVSVERGGVSEAVHESNINDDHLGTPKDFAEVEISSSFSAGPAGWNSVTQGGVQYISDTYSAVIAHELFHTCNVYHHGENDKGTVVWLKGEDPVTGKDAVLEGSGVDKAGHLIAGGLIVVKREDGTPIPPDLFATPTYIWVGKNGQQHSGCTDCVMRYDVAGAYIPDSDPTVRYWTGGEQTGMGLCDSKSDVWGGENAASRKPRPRFGDASKGNCKHQICVNDGAGK